MTTYEEFANYVQHEIGLILPWGASLVVWAGLVAWHRILHGEFEFKLSFVYAFCWPFIAYIWFVEVGPIEIVIGVIGELIPNTLHVIKTEGIVSGFFFFSVFVLVFFIPQHIILVMVVADYLRKRIQRRTVFYISSIVILNSFSSALYTLISRSW